MENKLQKTLLAGVIGTVVMTVVMMVAPMMGMPKMSPPAMLADMLGIPIAVGWIMHFMIGITFAFFYTYLPVFRNIGNVWISGIVFGVAAFIFAMIAMKAMSMMLGAPAMEGSMMMTIIGRLIGHIVFGVAVAVTVGSTKTV